MSFEQEQGVYLGRPYLLLYMGFVAVLLLDIVLRQGELDVIGGAEVTVLLIGILGLMIGYIVNIKEIRTGQPTQKDRDNLLNFGVGFFIVVTLIDTLLLGWNQYVQSMQNLNVILILAAAPFEEALFRLAIASVLYRSLNPFAERGFGSTRIFGRVTSSDLMTMLVTSLITSWLFTIYHTGVYGATDSLVMAILFINSFIYTMVFLYTGDIMTSTTLHLLHNAAVLFL